MKLYQERVLVEKEELDARIKKLDTFMDGPVFMQLHPDERGRMVQQRGYMTSYSLILLDRIKAFLQ